MVKKILFALLLLVVVVVGVVAMQPAEFRITRSAVVHAPPEAVFAQVNDFHRWNAWSPWAKLDPNATNSFAGSEAGTGAVFHWSGNHEVGEGSMTIEESRPHDLIRLRLEFKRPFPDTCETQFRFESAGSQTKITWDMAGHKNFVAKAVGLCMDMDKCVGDQFEAGLANLKAIVEAN